jgi:Zincin-like metallopeptidase
VCASAPRPRAPARYVLRAREDCSCRLTGTWGDPCGTYDSSSDTVSIDPDRSAFDGMGGEDGYYVVLLHELLHATGHTSRLWRASLYERSDEAKALEECTTEAALRIVLEELGFPDEALDHFTPRRRTFELSTIDPENGGPCLYRFDPPPIDRDVAQDMADWVLRPDHVTAWLLGG